ncbi:MAG TPA: DUF177 domain-containing protein [Pyrinomonadaceae bacterium]|nr:DUF177 domain-containing protein [Pyrinomonadaceae bacterium]
MDRLEELGGKFSQSYEVDSLPLDDRDIRLTEPAEVRGRIKRSGSEVELRGELHAKIEAVCSRCLKPVELPIHAEFAERFVPAVSWRAEEQHELREEDLNLAVFDGEAIELNDLVREEILLAMPGHVLCSEDCRGLCPICGIDRNAGTCPCESADGDLRWKKLKELQSRS